MSGQKGDFNTSVQIYYTSAKSIADTVTYSGQAELETSSPSSARRKELGGLRDS